MPEKVVSTPTGFLAVKITIDRYTPEALAFVMTAVRIYSSDGTVLSTTALAAEDERIIPLSPGKYRVRATLGTLLSEQAELEIKAGQTEKVVFHFGKET
jgi:hypothetical protein